MKCSVVVPLNEMMMAANDITTSFIREEEPTDTIITNNQSDPEIDRILALICVHMNPVLAY